VDTLWCYGIDLSDLEYSANCNANPDFIPVASGGDGASVQFCEFVHAFILE